MTAFCPTAVACEPRALRAMLAAVGRARAHPPPGAPADAEALLPATPDGFDADDVLRETAHARADVGIVTLAPELPGALDLVATLVARRAPRVARPFGRHLRRGHGGRPVTVRDAACLDDGTLAGSVLTMDRAFAFLMGSVGLGLVDAAHLCATTPARELGLRATVCWPPVPPQTSSCWTGGCGWSTPTWRASVFTRGAAREHDRQAADRFVPNGRMWLGATDR